MDKFRSTDVAEYYSRKQIETASKSKKICMLHERCVYLLLQSNEVTSKKPLLLIKVQNILSQLQLSLILHDPIAQSLFYLYDYCYLCLERGNVQDIKNTLEILEILKNTFQKLLKRP